MSIEDDGEFFRKQLVQAHAIVNVNPALTRPVVALWSTAKTREEEGSDASLGVFGKDDDLLEGDINNDIFVAVAVNRIITKVF